MKLNEDNLKKLENEINKHPHFALPEFHSYDIVTLNETSELYETYGDCTMMILDDLFAIAIMDNRIPEQREIDYYCLVLYPTTHPRILCVKQSDLKRVGILKRSEVKQFREPFNKSHLYSGIPIDNTK